MSNTFVFSHPCAHQASPLSQLYWLIGCLKKSIMYNTVKLQSKFLFKRKFWFKSYLNVTFLYTLTIFMSFGWFCSSLTLFFSSTGPRTEFLHLIWTSCSCPPLTLSLQLKCHFWARTGGHRDGAGPRQRGAGREDWITMSTSWKITTQSYMSKEPTNLYILWHLFLLSWSSVQSMLWPEKAVFRFPDKPEYCLPIYLDGMEEL